MLERSAKGAWTLNGAAARGLKGCTDVDLGCSPSTNTLQIRRLRLAVGAEDTIKAAWVRFPELDVVVVAEWGFKDTEEDTFAPFVDRLAAVQLALMTAFPQIDEQAIQPLEEPGEPLRSPEGYSTYRARFGFHLLDVVHT